jgi:PAS domain S-box-containing protein
MEIQKKIIDKLLRENASLKRKNAKLIRELSFELHDNIEKTSTIHKKDKNLDEILGRHKQLFDLHKKLESRYSVMAENVNDMISVMDTNGKYVYANNACARFHLKNMDDMIGKPFHEIMTDDVAKKFEADLFNPVLLTAKTRSGSVSFKRSEETVYIQCTSHPVFDDAGQIIGMINITRDTTESKYRQVYAEIEHQINILSPLSEEMEVMLKKIFIGLCQLDYIDFAGSYIMNEETGTLDLMMHNNLPENFVSHVKSYGTETPEYKVVSRGAPHYDYMTIQANVPNNYCRTLGMKSIATIPLVIAGKVLGCINLASFANNPFTESRKGFLEGIAWRFATLISLYKTHEELKKTVDVLNLTINELLVKQQILIQKSKMESLGELSAGMAHEINQPLVIISLSIENIQQKLSANPGEISHSYLGRKFDSIKLNISRIEQIIKNLQVFARDQSGILFEKLKVTDVIGATVEMAGHRLKEEGIRLVFDNSSDDSHVIGNFFKLEQVFLNILTNALFAVAEKARLSGCEENDKRIEIVVKAAGDQVIIDFTDNGTGIKEENIEKLFVPFYTTKQEGDGTGLGLAIVYGLVKEMKGEISVTSKLHEFTNVRLIFPLV